MNKIIAGFIGLLMVTAVVGGTAYALFFSTATVSGVTFATGNADLLVSANGINYSQDYNFAGTFFTGLYPTQDVVGSQFSLKNNSTANIALDLVAQLNGGAPELHSGFSWDALKDVIYVGFDYYNGTWNTATQRHTLNQWFTSSYALEGGNLPFGTSRWYRMHVSVANAGNEIADQGLTSTVFTFTGTQKP
ncbi:MAG: hypothetical protein V1922_00380 [bacterium]